MRVMIGCLGLHQPNAFSRFFCPLIFLALHPQNKKYHHVSSATYRSAMMFWQERFSRYPEWVATLRRMLLQEHRGIPVLDSGVGGPIHLMFGVTGSPLVPHYTASAQEDMLQRADIAAEVDACARMTFKGLADPTAVPPTVQLHAPLGASTRPYRRTSVPSPPALRDRRRPNSLRSHGVIASRSPRSPRSPRIHPGGSDTQPIQSAMCEDQEPVRMHRSQRCTSICTSFSFFFYSVHSCIAAYIELACVGTCTCS